MAMWVLPVMALQAAAGPTAEEALVDYREAFRRADCARGAGADEIVVCARQDVYQPERVPFSAPPAPGAPVRIAGEAPGGTDALAAERCLRTCPGAAGVDLLAVPNAVVRGVRRILDPDSG